MPSLPVPLASGSDQLSEGEQVVRYDLAGAAGRSGLVDEVVLGPGCRPGQWPIIGSAVALCCT
jgi:hypothetical protein